MEISRFCLDEQLMIKYYVMKHLILLKHQNVMGINKELLHWFISFLGKLADELQKPIIRKPEKHSSFKDNIQGC